MKGSWTMRSSLGIFFGFAACWFFFLQWRSANYLSRIQKRVDDVETQADHAPLLTVPARAPIQSSSLSAVLSTTLTAPRPQIEPGEIIATSHVSSESFELSKSICFITSEYADEAHFADKLSEPALASNPGFRHFLFTNLADLKPIGWTQIVTNLTFSNHIIESRYAKFLGWKFSEIQDACRVAIYIDGSYKTSDRPEIFEKVAEQVINKPSHLSPAERPGWMQFVHNLKREGPLGELKAIEKLKKDTKGHVQQTADWLYSKVPTNVTDRTAWLADIPVYLNTWIAYNPKSLHFQRVTDDFWSVYSRGIMSWRDQPTWAFFVHKHGTQPLPFPGRRKTYFKLQVKAEGFGGHTYVEDR